MSDGMERAAVLRGVRTRICPICLRHPAAVGPGGVLHVVLKARKSMQGRKWTPQPSTSGSVCRKPLDGTDRSPLWGCGVVVRARGDSCARRHDTPDAAMNANIGEASSALDHHMHMSPFRRLRIFLVSREWRAVVDTIVRRHHRDTAVHPTALMIRPRDGRSLEGIGLTVSVCRSPASVDPPNNEKLPVATGRR